MAGAHALMAALRAKPPAPGVRVVSAPCIGACHRAPACALGHELVEHATADVVADAIAHGPPPLPDPPGLDSYLSRGGYAALRAARADEKGARDTILAALEAGALRGLGGAGFPASRKWRLVMSQPAPRHLVVNADEGEPGTFKDRYCLEKEPHRMLEGMLVAAHAIEAEACWIYLRDEYPHLRRMLEREIAALAAAGLADMPIHLRRGAGAYICGEETALLESLEGRRGYPRHKPPFPGERGLFGRPTLIHNVETLWLLPEILAAPDAAARHAAMGRRGRKGVRFFSVSGRVRKPGEKLAPAGVSARELIEEFSGGMLPGHRFAAYLPGGASGGILPAVARRPAARLRHARRGGLLRRLRRRGGAVRPGRPGGGGAQPRAASSATRAAANAPPAASAPPRRRGCSTRRFGTARCSRSWRRRWPTAPSAASAKPR